MLWAERSNMDNEQVTSEKIEIPEIVYQGDDKKLKERIHKFKTGSFRIFVFTIMGLFMGFYSHTYIGETFLPMKIILAVPYKLSEAIYTFFLGTDSAYLDSVFMLYAGPAMFPHSALATILAESVTTVLIGGAIYGSLAYFTGDKRVFTLQRYLKFAGCWCGVILLTIGAVYGVNAKAVADNERLSGQPDFYLHHGKLSYNIAGGSGVVGRQSSYALRELLYEELEPMQVVRNTEKEVEMQLEYGFENMGGLFARVGYYRVNYEDCYLVTERGKTYRVSEEFARVIGVYYETGKLPEDMKTEFSESAGEEAEGK